METTFTQNMRVEEKHTASSLGSGSLLVFATPALVAFMENTAMKMIQLPEGKTSVGTSIDVKHLKASPVGAEVSCTARLTKQEERKYTFEIEVLNEAGEILGTAIHERFSVDSERFMSKLH